MYHKMCIFRISQSYIVSIVSSVRVIGFLYVLIPIGCSMNKFYVNRFCLSGAIGAFVDPSFSQTFCSHFHI